MRKVRSKTLEWQEAPEIKESIEEIISIVPEFVHIDTERIFCYRTNGSTSRSYARIWSFPKIFQQALGIEAAYVIEVLSKHYDKLSDRDQKKVLIHELLHIPKNFSGSLLPHSGRNRSIGQETNVLFKKYSKNKL